MQSLENLPKHLSRELSLRGKNIVMSATMKENKREIFPEMPERPYHHDMAAPLPNLIDPAAWYKNPRFALSICLSVLVILLAVAGFFLFSHGSETMNWLCQIKTQWAAWQGKTQWAWQGKIHWPWQNQGRGLEWSLHQN